MHDEKKKVIACLISYPIPAKIRVEGSSAVFERDSDRIEE